MKWLLVLYSFMLFVSFGCNQRQREEELKQRELQLNQKEQELSVREKTIQFKEEQLAKREALLDSASIGVVDSNAVYYPALEGMWNVRMLCTETTCPGSAVGDTKNEQWQIFYYNQTVVARAMANNKVVRIYTGVYANNQLELTAQQLQNIPQEQNAKIVVRVREVKPGELEGVREIVRPEECKITYALNMKKQS